MITYQDFLNTIQDIDKNIALNSFTPHFAPLLRDLLKKEVKEMASDIGNIMAPQPSGNDFYTYVTNQIQSILNSLLQDCTNKDELWEKFLESIPADYNITMGDFINELIEDNQNSINSIEDIASHNSHELAIEIYDLPCSHPLKHGLAAFILNSIEFFWERSTHNYIYTGVLKDNQGNELKGYKVEIKDLDAHGDVQNLGSVKSDENGIFTFTYNVMSVDDPLGENRNIELTIYDNEDNPLDIGAQPVLQIGDTDLKETDVEVSISDDDSPSFEQLETEAAIVINQSLKDDLEIIGITTLLGVTKAGNLLNIPSVTEGINSELYTESEVKHLQAHARLNMISEWLKANEDLINAGYTSARFIASKTRFEFVNDAVTNSDLTNIQSVLIYLSAKNYIQYLHVISHGIRANISSDMPFYKKFENL